MTVYEEEEAMITGVKYQLDRVSTRQEINAIYKRARNYHTHSVAKNANVIDYKRATGLEAVIGYIYLIADYDRLNKVLDLCVKGDKDESRRS